MTTRRELVKTLSAVGATSALWSKPVVESVVLPAHASTTRTNGMIQLFTSDFLTEITGDPPEVTIGEEFGLLISTDRPNTKLYATNYKDGSRVGDVLPFTTGEDGKAYLLATPEPPTGIEVIRVIGVGDVYDQLVLEDGVDINDGGTLFLLAFLILGAP